MKSRGNNRNGKQYGRTELSAQMIDIIGANNQAHSRLNRNVAKKSAILMAIVSVFRLK